MKTISLCMIVKNEEKVLARCLDSVADLMDEIIIIDTGSTDKTKEIAKRYTDKIFDFKWTGSFSDARNFSFSKASMEYIYAPDADEVLDEINHKRFHDLKEVLLDEIEIVQMYYVTPKEHNTVQNAKKELRPKLFKRNRTFTWIDPIHETVRTSPIVFDSDIEILHLPESSHGKRDFSIFEKTFKEEHNLSEKLIKMYAKELYKCGDKNDFFNALPIFLELYNIASSSSSNITNCIPEILCIIAHCYRLKNDVLNFFKYALSNMVENPCSEMCYEIGYIYKENNDPSEAILWLYNCSNETSPVIDVSIPGEKAYILSSQCYKELFDITNDSIYLNKSNECISKANSFSLPDIL